MRGEPMTQLRFRLRLPIWSALLLSGTLAACDAAPDHGVAGPSTPRAEITDDELARMPTEDQAQFLEPLRQIANAVDEIGREAGADVYGGLALQPGKRSVLVYVTDPAAAPRLLDAARAAHPELDFSAVTIERAAWSKRELHDARDRLLAAAANNQLPYVV